MSIDGIINEPTVGFVGKDGFFWWVGEVEDNEDPMELGRVKVRVLGYYTNIRGGTTSDLPTEKLPWATVLQHTSQPGNDGQGESSGQLQPGAIVMGFFMDGEDAQMPIVIGVLRVNKSPESGNKNIFAFTGENMEPGSQGHVNPVLYNPADPGYNEKAVNAGDNPGTGNKQRNSINNSVPIAGNTTTTPAGGYGSPMNVGTKLPGSTANPKKPKQPRKPIPAANGVGGPWKTLEYQLSYLFEDLADTAGTLVRAEDGEFLDIVEGKLMTAKALTAKIQNFLGAVFAQVVSAIRQQVSQLASELELVNILGGADGTPFLVLTVIQQAVSALLSSLCNIDSQLISFIQDPIGSIVGILEGYLDQLIDRAAFIVQGVQSVIDSVICNVQKILDQIMSVVDVVKGIVDGVGQAKEIIDAWQASEGIFSEGFDLVQNGIKSITGLIAMFIKYVSGGCNRTPDGGKDTVGWFPLFGVTHCTEEELAEINRIRGIDKARGDCASGESGGSLIDNIINEADPYLTAAKTFLDGSYEMFVGTPGRQASIKKSASGTTHTSLKLNNSEYAERKARQQVKESNPDATEEEIEKEVQAYKKSQNSGKGDTGNLVSDDINYSGELSQTVAKSDCKAVGIDLVRNVEGDVRIKCTGDFHLEVGGGFFVSAAGSPKVVDANGEPVSDKIQKHTMTFNSDLDINVAGAKLALQGSELEVGTQSTYLTGSCYQNRYTTQAMVGASLNLTGDSTIDLTTTHFTRNINVLNPLPTAKVCGITTIINGHYLFTQQPSTCAPVPSYTIQNSQGPFLGTFGKGGYILNVNDGAYSCSVLTGAWNTEVKAGAAALTCAAGNMTLTAPAGIIKITGKTIYLN